LLKQTEIERRRLLRLKTDIDIRWNSTYDMILRAMRLRVPLKSWLEAQMEKDPALDRLTLTNTDWKKLRYLIVLLRPFATFTNLLGSTTDTTINHTWNVYNSLFNHLEDIQVKFARKNTSTDPWISEFTTAINAGLEKLKEYYSKTGGEVEKQYALAGMLDPSQKLDIFRSPDWSSADMKRYQRMFFQYWEDFYKGVDDTVCDDIDAPIINAPPSLNSVFRLNREIPGVRATTAKPDNEAESFLRSLIVKDRSDTTVLSIWKRLDGSYPSVARMARDILVVPGT
jgi:hypothetical protein